MPRNSMTAKKSNGAVLDGQSGARRSKTPARRRKSTRAAKPQVPAVPRATAGYDEDDVMLSGGGTSLGAGYGRCGGRVLSSQIEQRLCDMLSTAGVTHSHSPRHFEVQLGDSQVGAYAPMIVLRGRGREGKTIVIEATTAPEAQTLAKIEAFRAKYGQEFYLVFVAPEDVLDEISILAYDESCTDTDVHTLVSRLSE